MEGQNDGEVPRVIPSLRCVCYFSISILSFLLFLANAHLENKMKKKENGGCRFGVSFGIRPRRVRLNEHQLKKFSEPCTYHDYDC